MGTRQCGKDWSPAIETQDQGRINVINRGFLWGLSKMIRGEKIRGQVLSIGEVQGVLRFVGV